MVQFVTAVVVHFNFLDAKKIKTTTINIFLVVVAIQITIQIILNLYMIDQAVLQLSPAQKSLDVLGFGAVLVKIGEFSGKNLKSSVVCSYIF